MHSATTTELGLTRLWYLIGDWEGTGKGPDFRFRATVRCEWALDDHFMLVRLDLHDPDTDQLRIAEQQYIYHDRDSNCLESDVFGLDGLVEHTVGHADARGRMVLTTERLRCVPTELPFKRLRRTTWMKAASQWAFTIEQDRGWGFAPYLEGQMRRRS